MSGTQQRLSANRANALKSTGPTSTAGKSTASRNATRHGLLSARLLLDDEDPSDFDALLLELQSALAPAGHLELALVERVAIALWRQRRIVMAESAAIGLARHAMRTAAGVTAELALGYENEIKEDDLQPFDQERIAFCRAVLAETETLDEITLGTLPQRAPSIFEQLTSDAAEDGATIEEHLDLHDKGLTGYVGALVEWCHEQLRDAERRPRILALAEQVKTRNLILPEATIEVLSRYQTTLDNQLYKALRALRDAQEWRLKSIDATLPGTVVVEDAA